MGFSCLIRSNSPRGDKLFFTAKSPGFPVTYFIDLERVKSSVDEYYKML